MMRWIEMLVEVPPLVSILAKITIILAFGWIAHLCLRRYNPRWRVLLWRGVIVGVLLVPILMPLKYLEVPVPPPSVPAVSAPIAFELEVATVEPVIEIADIYPTDSVAELPPEHLSLSVSSFSIVPWAKENIWLLLALGWALVAVLITLRFVAAFVRIRKKVRSSVPGPKRLEALLNKVAEDLDCGRRVTLMCSTDFTSPFLTGLRRPIIILPERMTDSLHADELRAVFAHEVAHLRSRDLWWMAAARWFGIVFWFHPLAWKLRDAHSTACEEVCDAVAADYIGNAQAYSGTLASIALQIVGRVPAVAGIPMARSSEILGRLRLLQRKIYSLPLARHWMVSSLLAGLVCLLVLGGLRLVYAERSDDASANLKEGLVLYYSFDNDKDRKVTDLSGQGNHGRLSSGTYIADGKIGRAMYFNGDGDYIDIGDDSSIQSDVFTITAWIKTSDTSLKFKDRPILSFADHSYVVSVRPDGGVLYEVSRQKVGGAGTTDVRTGQWVFVAVTRDSNNEGSIYVNGRLENTFTCDATSRFTYSGKIGGDYAHHEYFHGSIDQVRIYNRALSTSQIEDLYNTTNRPDTGAATAEDIRMDRDRPLGQINVTGTVHDEKGKAVSDALITLLPGGTSAKKQFRTDAEGRFSGHYSLRFGPRDIYIHSVYVLARHRQRNLAAAVRIPKSRDQKLEITLAEPVTLTGRISDPDGNPIRQASIHVWFGDGSRRTFFARNDAGTAPGEIAIDDKGSFEIKSVPHGCFYAMKVKAEGYGVKALEVGTWDTREKFIDLGRIVLAPANLSVSGVVVNENGKPVANADISLYGKGQAWSSEWSDIGTDANGNFRIRNLCPGTITIWAHVEKHGEQTGEQLGGIKQGKLDAQAGEEDVRIVVKDVVVRNPETPKPLIGKQLPDLQGININFNSDQAKDKRLLICFFRMGQGKEAGESRHCLMKLVHMAEELEKKDIRVLVVYDGSEGEQSLADLKSRIPFPVGIFEGEIEKVAFKWGLRGWWPRAILTDRDHTAISEGHGWQVIRGLDKKLKAAQGNPAVPAPALSPKGKDERPDDLAGRPGTRVIRLPKDRSMGIVYVGELRTTDPLWWQGWEEVGQAKGDVAVPADKDVRLTINADGLENLSFLKALGPDDIQALNFVYPLKRLDDNGLAHLAGLTGLRLLRLDGASIRGEGLRHLSKLKKLEALHAPSTEIADEGLRHVGRIGSLLALSLGMTPATDKGLAHLRDLNSLRFIGLGQTSITGSGFSHLAGLESLTYAHLCDSGLTDEGLREVAKLKSLEILRLEGTKVTDRGIAHLEDLTRLRELTVPHNDGITDACLEHIGKITSLERLDLPDGVTDAGLEKLTSLTKLKRLNIAHMLYLGGGLEPLKKLEKLECLLPPEVTDEDLAVVGSLTSLQELWINNSPITDQGLAHLAPLKSLRKLWLHNGHKSINMDVTVSGLDALKAIPLTYLHLWNIKLDDSRLAALANFPTLEELNLHQMPIQDEDLAVVGKLSQLTWLTFTTDTVSDGGLEYLTGLTRLEDFQPITPLTDKGLYHIGKMKMRGRLVVKGHFTDEGLRHLEGLSSLRQLRVTTTAEISTEAQERLRRKLPNLSYCSVQRSREARQPPKVGQPAPAFALRTFDDKEIKLEDFRGKAVLLYFWATWCTPCKASTPDLKQFYARLKKRHGNRFVMLGLSQDSSETLARRYVEKETIPWPQVCIGLHSEVAADYGVYGLPIYFVIGPDGKIAADDNAADLEAVIDAALKAEVDSLEKSAEAAGEGAKLQQLIAKLKVDDPDERVEAVRKLGDMGAEAVPAIPALIESLTDRGAIDGPNGRSFRAVTGSSLSLSADKPGWLAAEALGKIGAPAVEPLIEAIRKHFPTKEYIRAPHRTQKYGPGHDGLVGLDNAERALVEIGAPAVQPLINVLSDDDRLVRIPAVWALGRIKDERAVQPLMATLKDKDKYVRTGVVFALGWIGDKRAVELLIVTLNEDQGWHMRRDAATALGRIGDKRALPYLIAALDKKDEPIGAVYSEGYEEDVRRSAASSLGWIGDSSAVETLIKTLDDEDEGLRCRAAYALGEIGDSRATEPLLKLLHDPKKRVREAAKIALDKIKAKYVETQPWPKEYEYAKQVNIAEVLKMTLSTDKTEYKHHEPVELTVTLTNKTDKQIKFWRPDENDRVFQLVMKCPGHSASLDEFRKAGDAFVTDQVTINGSESLRITRTIEPYYLGKHTIGGKFRLRLIPDTLRGRLQAEAISFVVEESADADRLLKTKFDRLIAVCKREFEASGRYNWFRLARLGLDAEEYLIAEIDKAHAPEFRRCLESALRKIRQSP